MNCIDRAPYLSIPRTSARRLLAVARLLSAHAPEQSTPQIARAHAILIAIIDALSLAYVQRCRELGPTAAADALDLHALVDRLWLIVRDRLDHWQVFQSPAALHLARAPLGDPASFSGPAEGASFDSVLTLDQARHLESASRLLGVEGPDFTGESMAAFWAHVQAQGLTELLVDAVGVDFFEALRDSHARSLAVGQSPVAQGPRGGLRELHHELSAAVQNYLIALLAFIDDDDPESVALVTHALRPMDALRGQIERERRAGETLGFPAPTPDPEGAIAALMIEDAIIELLETERAVDAEVDIEVRAASLAS